MDESAQDLLKQLRENHLPEALTSSNVIQYDVKWHRNGINPGSSSEHFQYIEKLCADFYKTLTDKISQGIEENDSVNAEDPLTEEVFQHGSFCKRKSELFYGRDEFLTSVQKAVTNDRVAVLHGESGCGKTSLMAKIATKVKKWLGKESTSVVLRFIGTTPDSSDLRNLLQSICEQLSRAHQTGEENRDDGEEKAQGVPQVKDGA